MSAQLETPRGGDGDRGAELWLASASPRRSELLGRAGLIARVVASDIDDAALDPRGATPAAWCVAMAWFKARRVVELLARDGRLVDTASPRWLVAADTVCDLDGRIVGKPVDAAECAALLHAFSGREHRVFTGVCVIDLGSRAAGRGVVRTRFADVATVSLGSLDGRSIDEYVASGRWVGKAGGYNYDERLDAGWPLRCEGDPTCVTGLPMRRLEPMLRSLVGREVTTCW